MLRKKEIIVVLLAGILCFSTAWAEERTIATREPKTGQIIAKHLQAAQIQSDPYENTSVLVEAFVVRVSNQALVEADISPVGQSPEGVSILKILWCLKDGEKAQVISGAKAMEQYGREATSKSEEKFPVKFERVNTHPTQQGPVETKDITFNEYTSWVQFNVQSWVQAENRILLKYSYSESGVTENKDTTSPPDQFSYDWNGTLTVQSGKPVIAGAVQNKDNTAFLILTATIQDSGNAKK